MKLDLAKAQISSNHGKESPKIVEKVLEALDALFPMINEFEESHIEKVYDIEKISPSYFPGLSCASATTILAFRQANPALDLNFILDTVDSLARSSRPWEQLSSFQSFALYCRSEINQENIGQLLKVNSNIIEIVGSEIRNTMTARKESMLGRSYQMASSVFSLPPLQFDKDLFEIINKYVNRFFPGAHSNLSSCCS